MTFQSAPQMASAAINGDYFGKPIANVLNFWLPSAPGQADLDNLAHAVDVAVGTDYLALMANNCNYVSTITKGLTSLIDYTSTDTTNAGPGTGGSIGVASNQAFCLTLRTAFAGRSARGRTFLFPTATAFLNTPVECSTGYATAAVQFMQLVQSGALVYGWVLSVLSRQNGGVIRPTAVHYPVTAIVMRNRVSDSQRGRLPVGH